MLKNFWLKIKRVAFRFGRFLAPMLKPLFRFLGVSAILAIGWFAFLFLVPHPPIDTTSALIMVWSSIAILLIALFPRIFDRIKKFKLKDFEIELQDTVAKSTPEDYISLSDLDEHAFSEKGNFHDLEDILEQATRQPSKPILLTANLRNGEYISIPMLFVYLYFLDMIGNSVTVLFISTGHNLREIADIEKESIVGAISGRNILRTFYRRFPHFARIFDTRKFIETWEDYEEFFRHGRFRQAPSEFVFRRAYDVLRNASSNEREYLTIHDVRNWFKGDLNYRTVEAKLDSQDIKTIREALAQGDEYILSIKDKGLRSVISLCYFAKNLSKKVLADISATK